MNARVIYKNSDYKLVANFGTDNMLYGNVLRVRKMANAPVSFDFDKYSTHYVLFRESNPVGSLTSTRHMDGEIDCEEFYPPAIFDEYGHQLASTCKFRILKDHTNGMRTLRLMVRNVWQDLLKSGIRVDIINIRQTDVRVFERIGYSVIPNTEFVHPKLKTKSIGMVMHADPNRASFVSDIFQNCLVKNRQNHAS